MFRAALIALSVTMTASAGSAWALTQQECSAKYNAAKQAGTLGSTKWNEFRKTQCSDQATPAATAAPAATQAAPAPAPAPSPAATATPPAASTPAASGPAVFPKAVDPKYASESAGKGRMKTCVDQYNANKATGGNGGLKWIAKGGGYYSECNKRLKG